MMRRSSPFSDFEELFERMARQFDEMGRRFSESGMWESGTGTIARGISIDLADHGDEFTVTADLPGFEKDDIDLSISDQMLTIRAKREMDAEESDEGYVHRERRHASAQRTIRLPESVDEEGATAAYRNGVLTITLPKHEVAEDSHRIDID